ncbi:MAG TPA: hypothetical protein VMF70_06255 [Gemmatimonadales bacterium]|nr:hypothetical protein [Gemmatimonadales bacterium]
MLREHGVWYGVHCHKCGSEIPLAEGGEKAERYTHPALRRLVCPGKHCGYSDHYKFPDELVRFPVPTAP